MAEEERTYLRATRGDDTINKFPVDVESQLHLVARARDVSAWR